MAYHKTFQSLRVTAQLRTGVVSDQWLPLDALIWYQAHRYWLGSEQATLPGGSAPVKCKVSIPLKIIHPYTDKWYFASSWAQPQPWWAAEGQDYWNKRFDNAYADLVDFGKRRGKVVIEQGRYKAYHMPVFYRAARKIEWYCVGDKAEIEMLLSMMTHIGKKSAQGWGRVSRWTVKQWPEDWSVWCEGQLMRGVPTEDALELIQKVGSFVPFNILNYGVRPSYYRSSNQMRLAVPG